jgi:acyl carrier protein
MTDTAARIRQILTEHLGVDEAPDTAHLAQDLQADSLDTIEIAMALEEAFGIELPDSAMENTATVADLIALVERVQKGAAA